MFGSFTPAMATPYVEGSPSSGYMSPYYNTASGSGSAASPGIYQSMSPSYVSMSPSRSMAGGDGQGFRMGSPQFNPRRLVHAVIVLYCVVAMFYSCRVLLLLFSSPPIHLLISLVIISFVAVLRTRLLHRRIPQRLRLTVLPGNKLICIIRGDVCAFILINASLIRLPKIVFMTLVNSVFFMTFLNKINFAVIPVLHTRLRLLRTARPVPPIRLPGNYFIMKGLLFELDF